ncbi:MAG: lantibiotic dehydratase family protein, partial [Psychrosphaera sp.]|nr:lantibiotic dehydratase family protein [Psychrosphaera sp.]
KLKHIDRQKLAKVSDYQQILTALTEVPVKAQENKLFQTDVYRAFDQCELDHNQLSRLLKQLKLIKALGLGQTGVFNDFINSFNQRYEGQFVPLDQLLDDESGISFSEESGYEATLLAGLQLGQSSAVTSVAAPPSLLDRVITEAISTPQNRTKSVIELHSKDLSKQLYQPLSDHEFPASFAAMVSLYEDQQQQPLLKLNGCYGSSAANLLGRFCHLDEGLKEQLITHLDRESAHSADVIIAEVVHMPEGRPGNVIARPHLRPYEIVFLADSSLGADHQILLSDLYVWIEERKVKLWSKRLNKQIVPRMSSAHNYTARSLSAYKFLNMMTHQNGFVPTFNMPDSQKLACFVPRIMLDNLILSEKTWRIPRDELAAVLENDQLNSEKWRKLKDKYQLDDHLSYAVNDNVLQLNLANPLQLGVLLAETKHHSAIELREVLTSQYATPVKSAAGQSFANELIIPFFNSAAEVHQHFHDDPQANIMAKPIKRRFSPGSSWLRLKIYSGNTALDT